MRCLALFCLLPMVLGASEFSPSLETIAKGGNYRKGGGAVAWAPIGSDCDKILFGQAEGGLFRDLYVGTLGVGYRQQAEPGFYSWGTYFAWGANAFFDVARSNSGQVYHQGGLGGEILGNCWLLRANGYWVSLGSHVINRRRESQVRISGTNLITTDTHFNTVEQGYNGFDLEVGKGFQICNGQLWGYAGYYRFDGANAKEQGGPRLRLEYILDQALSWCPLEVTLGGDWEHNDRHGSTLSGYLSMRLPLYAGCNTCRSTSCCDNICRLMGNRVVRNHAPWVDNEVRRSSETFTLPQQIIFATETGGPLNTEDMWPWVQLLVVPGSQSDPLDIDAAVTAATREGDIIFALADGGPLDPSSTIALLDRQQLWSFGDQGSALINLGEGRSVRITPLDGASSAAATIIGTSNAGTMIQVSPHATCGGLMLDGDSNTDLCITGTTDLEVINDLQVLGCSIQNFQSTGIDLNVTGIMNPIEKCLVSRCLFGGVLADGIDLFNSGPRGASVEVVRSAVSVSSQCLKILGSVTAATPYSCTVRGCMFSGTLGIVDDISAAWTDLNFLMDNNAFVSDEVFSACQFIRGSANGGTLNNVIINSTGEGSPQRQFLWDLGGSPGQINHIMARNVFTTLPTNIGVVLDSSELVVGSQYRLLMEGNVFAPLGSGGLLRSVMAGPPTAHAELTVRNNRGTGDVSTFVSRGPTVSGPGQHSVVATFDGNLFPNSMTFVNSVDLPSFSITNLNILSSLNRGTSTSLTGTNPEFFETVAIPAELP